MHALEQLRQDTDHPIILALIFVSTILASAYAVYLVVQDLRSTVFAVSVALGMFALIYDAATREKPQNKRQLARWLIDAHRPTLKHVLLAFGVLLVGTVTRIVVGLLQGIFRRSGDTATHSMVDAGPPEGTTLILLALAVIVVGPLIEEIVFRGILQRFLTYHTGLAGAIGLTALIFAVGHAPTYGGFDVPIQVLFWPMLVVFVDSVLWGWLYHRSGNVLVSWIAHGSANGLAVVLWLL